MRVAGSSGAGRGRGGHAGAGGGGGAVTRAARARGARRRRACSPARTAGCGSRTCSRPRAPSGKYPCGYHKIAMYT